MQRIRIKRKWKESLEKGGQAIRKMETRTKKKKQGTEDKYWKREAENWGKGKERWKVKRGRGMQREEEKEQLIIGRMRKGNEKMEKISEMGGGE